MYCYGSTFSIIISWTQRS